jgi:AcrR family transcriptional regulator
MNDSPKRGSKQPPAEASTPGAETRVRMSREETTEAILDAAEELFSRRDPNRVTVREIAELAGVTHPLVHQYVGSKSDILDAVVARGAPARQLIMAAHPEYREAVPLLFADVLRRRVNTRSIVRSAMDGIEYAPFEDRLKTGQMLLGLARAAEAQGTSRPPAPGVTDPRIALASSVALAYGWVATQDWLIRIFDLQDEDPAEIDRQLEIILMSIADLIFPPAEDSDSRED